MRRPGKRSHALCAGTYSGPKNCGAVNTALRSAPTAPGYDENGNPVEIFMTFTQVKGEEIDPENLNWFQDSDRVEAL